MTSGFYYRNGVRHKSIIIKRPGVYGKGFMAKSKAARFSKIRREEKVEGPNLVHEQMAAMRAFTYRNPKYRKAGIQDLKYSEKIG